jgi:hypothetical protein
MGDDLIDKSEFEAAREESSKRSDAYAPEKGEYAYFKKPKYRQVAETGAYAASRAGNRFASFLAAEMKKSPQRYHAAKQEISKLEKQGDKEGKSISQVIDGIYLFGDKPKRKSYATRSAEKSYYRRGTRRAKKPRKGKPKDDFERMFDGI